MSPTSTPVSHDSFAIFLCGLHHQRNEAWQELTRRYTKRLVGLARQKLDVRLGAKLDPEDVVQSVYRLLNARLQGKGIQPLSWDHLWAMLAMLTSNRCKNWSRHYFETKKRPPEVPLVTSDESNPEVDPLPADFREPTPEEAAELAEEVRRLLPDLDAQTARIYWLGILGFGDGEVANRLSVSEARVRFAREDCTSILNQKLRVSEKNAPAQS